MDIIVSALLRPDCHSIDCCKILILGKIYTSFAFMGLDELNFLKFHKTAWWFLFINTNVCFFYIDQLLMHFLGTTMINPICPQLQ